MNYFNKLHDIDNRCIHTTTKENLLKEAVLNPNSIVKVPITQEYTTDKLSFLPIYGNFLYTDISINRHCFLDDDCLLVNSTNCDIISDIKIYNDLISSVEVLLDDNIIEFIPNRIIMCCAIYTKIRLRLIFKKDNIPNKLCIGYNVFVISNIKLYKNIIHNCNFNDCGLIYNNGSILIKKKPSIKKESSNCCHIL